ncbi:hypothetical protein [Nocardia sp. NPDC050710]|uniref:hypothetical protein n=1 Tax=Nocardia sp. NPDC050710 TaxID=3157220 RepID=UPI0033FF87B8
MGVNGTFDFDPDRVRALAGELLKAASGVNVRVEGKKQEVATELPDSVGAAMCGTVAVIAGDAIRNASQALHDLAVNATQAVSAVTGVDESFADEVKLVTEAVR